MNTNSRRCRTSVDSPSLISATGNYHPAFLLPSSVETPSNHNVQVINYSDSTSELNRRSKRPRFCVRLKRMLTNHNKSSIERNPQVQPQPPSVGQLNVAALPLSVAFCALNTADDPRASPAIYDEPVIRQQARRHVPCCLSRKDCSCWLNVLGVFCTSVGRVMGRRMPNENLFVLSMIQILCGLAAVILSGVAVTKLVFLYQMATGLWSGFLMLATGFHGILTSRRCNPRTLISLLIFCVLVALAACLLACVSVAGLIEDGLLRPDSSLSMLNTQPYFEAIRRPMDVGEMNTIRVKFPIEPSPRIHVIEVQPSRLHQVMLHVLLLVIGILEASVSVACAVLCCRQVCPSSDSPPLSAISYLQARGATLVPGGAEFLLAVTAGPNQSPPPLLDYSIPPPDFHPSAQPFLPRPGHRAFILTQAETGIHALAAAQTIARLVSPPRTEMQTQSIEPLSSTSSSLGLFHHNRKRRRQRSAIAQRRADAVQLNARLSALLPNLNSRMDDGGLRQRSSLLYVLSSPSADEPPMIFPPFPPAYYCDETPAPSYFSHQMQPHSFNLDPYFCCSQPPPVITEENVGEDNVPLSARPLLNCPPPLPPRRPSSLFSQLRPYRRSRSSNRRTNAPISLVGDRILQPVLIIEDNRDLETVSGSQQSEDPPSYASIDQHLNNNNHQFF